jgi:GNAT superfamily N-acetyltransferase
LWLKIGRLSPQLTEKENYSAVSVEGSDWPNRIFNVKISPRSITTLLHLSQEGKLPDMVTIPTSNNFDGHSSFDLIFRQQNMALDLKLVCQDLDQCPNINRVTTKKDAINFATIASESFGYKVDFNLIDEMVNDSQDIRLFIYQEKDKALGCGMVFFDSNNNAGLHMIGTLPEERGKGIGKKITERLLIEAKDNNVKFCVLHASIMGESIYRKLGFEPYGEIETYRIQK